MGQKVHPHGLRVGVIKDWDSRWFADDSKFGDLLVEDDKIRKYLKKTLYNAGVPRIEIERAGGKVHIIVHCAKPGMVIGKGGTEIEKLRQSLEKMIGKPVVLDTVEVKSPDLNAQLVAENIAAQLEKRISFRRAMKMAIGRAMKLGARGIKTAVGGRLGGAEIALVVALAADPACRHRLWFCRGAHDLRTHRREGVDLQGRGSARRQAHHSGEEGRRSGPC